MNFKNMAGQCLVISLFACGGGGSPRPPADSPPVDQQAVPYLVSADSPFAANCTLAPQRGEVNYLNAEVEPFVAVHPGNPKVLLGAWQQDRWNSGGANGLVVAVSIDGGASWKRKAMPFSSCGGSSKGSAGDFERASDPWVDIGADGTMYVMGLAVNPSNASNASGLQNAMVLSRSTDQGQTWSTPVVLRGDSKEAFNDKNSLTVSPVDPKYVYAVWDRVVTINKTYSGPVWLARSTNGGQTWEEAKEIYRPAAGNALGNRIAVLGDDTLVNVFTVNECQSVTQPDDPELASTAAASSGASAPSQPASQNQPSTEIQPSAPTSETNKPCVSSIQAIRSTDQGRTWSSKAITIAENLGFSPSHPQNNTGLRAPALPAIAVGPNGKIWVTWQDARFGKNSINSIALASSSDKGLTWSTPMAINKDTSSHAFTPSITVAKDGTIAVSHYDFRNYGTEPSKMLTNTWLLTSKDGQKWMETKIREPFDVSAAPVAGGLFLGDYQGLVSLGSTFLPFYAQANADANNRTDIYAVPVTPAPSTVYQARTAPILSTSQKIVLQSRAGLAMQDWMRARMQQRSQP